MLVHARTLVVDATNAYARTFRAYISRATKLELLPRSRVKTGVKAAAPPFCRKLERKTIRIQQDAYNEKHSAAIMTFEVPKAAGKNRSIKKRELTEWFRILVFAFRKESCFLTSFAFSSTRGSISIHALWSRSGNETSDSLPPHDHHFALLYEETHIRRVFMCEHDEVSLSRCSASKERVTHTNAHIIYNDTAILFGLTPETIGFLPSRRCR